MATALSTLAFSALTTDAAFRAAVGPIDANILAFGWLAAADTGQIDPATVAHPAAGADAGYRIYKTNDALTTWYLKIVYGNEPSNYLRLKATLGTGTNGAGTLTGQVSTTFTWDWPVPPASPTNLAMSGSNNRLMIFCGTYNGNRSANGLSIHRTVDNTGSVNDDGMEMFYALGSGLGCQFVPRTGTIPPAESGGWPVIFTRSTTGVVGGNVRFGHPFLWGETLVTNPTLAAMCWGSADFSPVSASTKTLTIYGTARTFLLDGDTHNSQFSGGNTRLGWRYE